MRLSFHLYRRCALTHAYFDIFRIFEHQHFYAFEFDGIDVSGSAEGIKTCFCIAYEVSFMARVGVGDADQSSGKRVCVLRLQFGLMSGPLVERSVSPRCSLVITSAHAWVQKGVNRCARTSLRSIPVQTETSNNAFHQTPGPSRACSTHLLMDISPSRIWSSASLDHQHLGQGFQARFAPVHLCAAAWS